MITLITPVIKARGVITMKERAPGWSTVIYRGVIKVSVYTLCL